MKELLFEDHVRRELLPCWLLVFSPPAGDLDSLFFLTTVLRSLFSDQPV